MADHLSSLAMDELLTGTARERAPAQAHLAQCEQCRARLDAMRGAALRARQSASFEHVSTRLMAQATRGARSPAPSSWRRWLLLAAPAAAAAVCAATFVVLSAAPVDRLKGAATLRVVPVEEGRIATSALHPGDRVALAVGAAGHRYALLLSVGDDGSVEALWPLQLAQSGAVSGRADERIGTPFQVTPGPATLLAFFSDVPLERAGALEALRRAVEAARSQGRSPKSVDPPPLPNELARARARLEIAAP